MAMDIIAKEKKSITWRGLPANAERNVQDLRVDKVLEHPNYRQTLSAAVERAVFHRPDAKVASR
jgi:hypothetical protein